MSQNKTTQSVPSTPATPLAVSENNKRIVKNTLMLYFRMLISMGISLYTSRVVLNTLGVTDFGIYNVVGGVVTTFTLISGSLSSAAQRFITFELGKKEDRNLPKVFSTTVLVHFVLAFIILILAESVGLWFLNTQLNIASSRMYAANWVYQCALLTFLVTLISTPYNAAIIAYERMKMFAYIGIGEVVLKLVFVILLPFLPFDKLIVFSFLLMIVAVIVRFIYSYYCKVRLKECAFAFVWDRTSFRDIASFAGWNFIGVSSAVLLAQGVTILLNIFFGVVVNAAQGVALQVQQAITGFITNFMTALNPQITKSYASNEHDYMMNLIFQGARYSFYLMFALSLPILIETQAMLKMWLSIVPDYAVIFVRLTLILAISHTFSQTLITAMLATGKIKLYQIIVGGIQMLGFPLSYIVLKLGFSPQSTIIVAIIMSFACLVARLILLRGMIALPVGQYFLQVLLNTVMVAALSTIIPLWIYFSMNAGFLRLACICGAGFISTIVVIYSFGVNKSERSIIHSKLNALRVKYGIVR